MVLNNADRVCQTGLNPHSEMGQTNTACENPTPEAIILRNYHRWSMRMEAVKISPKFQVVIPKKLREALKLSPGQKIQMVTYDNRIEMIPLKKISDMKGFLKGIDTTVERESDRTDTDAPSSLFTDHCSLIAHHCIFASSRRPFHYRFSPPLFVAVWRNSIIPS